MKIKQKNSTKKLYLTMVVLILAIMLCFYNCYKIGSASAEEINTTDEYIIYNVQEGDDLSGLTFYLDKNYTYVDISGGITSTLYQLTFTADTITLKNPVGDVTYYEMLGGAQFLSFMGYTLPADFGIVEFAFTSTFQDYILIENPDYIAPVATDTPVETIPPTQLETFLSGELIAGLSLGTVLLIFLALYLLKR